VFRDHSKTKEERAVARKRALILAVSCLCIILSAVLLMNLETPRGATTRYNPVLAGSLPSIPLSMKEPVVPMQPEVGTVGDADVDALRIRNLLIPVEGVTAGQLHDSFYSARSEGRMHQALDIMAPRDTPVLATDDGRVMKLHQSDRGGIMVYESDPSGIYVYCYGHLSYYADGLFEGKQLKRGEVIAYVGDTGNAGAGNYHLHFGISKMSAAGKWSGGEPINPYPLLTNKQSRISSR